MTSDYKVAGHVALGATSAGANDVQVYSFYYENGVWNQAAAVGVTDASGNFTVDFGNHNTVHLDYEYQGSANYLPQPYVNADNLEPSDPGVLHLAASVTSVTTSFDAGAEVDGVITNSTGSPVADAWVSVEGYGDAGNANAFGTAISRADGSYTVTRLGTDRYEVRARGSDPASDGQYFDQWAGGTAFDRHGELAKPATPVKAGHSVKGMNVSLILGGSIDVGLSCFSCTITGTMSSTIEAKDPADGLWKPITAPSTSTAEPGPASSRPNVYFEYSDLYPGTYRVITHYSGIEAYDDYTLITTLTPGQDVFMPVHLTQKSVQAAEVSPATSSFVTSLYADFLNRRPGSSEVSFWGGRLAAGIPRSAIANGFASSDEYRLTRIDSAYRTILFRAPDAQGRLFWLNTLRAGTVSIDDLEKHFYGSAEYFARSDINPSLGYVVYNLYSALLGRIVSYSEEQYWLDRASPYGYNNPIDQQEIVNEIFDSPEAASRRVSAMYVTYLKRSGDPTGIGTWTTVDLRDGDEAVRADFTTSDEYFATSSTRYAGN